MTKTIPSKAFILAAGHGTRLRPFTETRPKPLVEVNARTLLDRTLDQLCAAGVRDAVLNTHYLAEQIPAHLAERNDITLHYSAEPELLDTGGGIKAAIHHFDEAFYVLSGDGLWEGDDTLRAMAEAWDDRKMDILILLQPIDRMTLTQGVGDYDLDAEGRARRCLDKSGAYMFTSMRINSPRIFDAAPDGAFSYLDLLDEAQEKGRLYGIVHDGDWHHISTPDDLEAVDAVYRRQEK